MKNQTLVLILYLLVLSSSQDSECTEQNYIIPYETLDTVFDQGIDAVRNQQNMIALIQNPNSDTLYDYIISLLPYSAPLFVMAGVTFAIFIATIIQVICFNTCGKQCCGNQLNSSTYNICCLRTMTIFFILFSFFTMVLCIAALIVNSDLQKAIDFTGCNTINIINQTYDGNNNESMLWSGVSNFDVDIQNFAINIQNSIPALTQYFNSTSNAYKNVTNTATGSSYDLAITFDCPNQAVPNLDCPLPGNCNDPYVPLFYVQFCQSQIKNSARYLINQQIENNSTKWLNNIKQLSISLGNAKAEKAQLAELVTQVTNFTNSITNFQQNLDNGFIQAQNINYNIEIAFYVFYSFLLLCSLVSIATVCCTYYCNNFSCKCWTYVFWYTYFIFALALFILSGLFLTGSILTFDSCTAYPYFFTDQSNFNTLEFQNKQIGNIFSTCFFTDQKSIFAAFKETTLLDDFQTIRNQYSDATPSANFSSVVTDIQDMLYGYAFNPATIEMNQVPNEQQPSVALTNFNLFSNSSASQTTQGCGLTKLKTVYDPVQCNPFLINQPINAQGCFVLTPAYNFSVNSQSIYEDFLDVPCTTDAQTWKSNVTALNNFGQSAFEFVLSIAPIVPTGTSPSDNLMTYQTNYFNYYNLVKNYMNAEVQDLFQSFFDPYDSLTQGSSCQYITTSINGIVNIACNQLFPYFNAFSVLNIIISVLVFFMMILSYFLTTRYQFYEFLQGNFQNYGVQTYKTNQLPGYTLDSNREKDVELIQGNTSRY